MASDAMPASRATLRLRLRLVACAGLLAGVSAVAGAEVQSPRALVACALAAAVVIASGVGSLRRAVVAPLASEAAEPGLPRQDAARRAALLETRLEQAPVALWQQAGDVVTPLNNAARRLVAPGGATAPDELLEQLRAAPATARHALLTFDSERGPERCLLAARTLAVGGSETRLLALMPVESELQAETLKAWRELVHVLTHEIMNSLTPIASLSRTAQELLAERGARSNEPIGSTGAEPMDAANAANASDGDLGIALEAIARRAEALAVFVANYRRVSDWPEPALAPVALAPMFARLERLVGAEWQARGGTARFAVEPSTLTLMADEGQLEQALINLLKNAAQATTVADAPAVAVSARLIRGGRLAIEVRDNGPGVPANLERDIFTPFFSTREHGSGVGLAVVRNLVQGMGGSVRHARPVSGGAAFVLSF